MTCIKHPAQSLAVKLVNKELNETQFYFHIDLSHYLSKSYTSFFFFFFVNIKRREEIILSGLAS